MNISTREWVVGAGLLLAAGAAQAQSIQFAVVGKSARYDQISAATVVPQPFNPPDGQYAYNFLVRIIGNVSASFPAPPNLILNPPGAIAPNNTITFDTEDGGWDFDSNYASQAALDTDYPNGNYTFSLNGGAAQQTLSLAGDAYPNAPQITASQGTWLNGTLLVDPALPLQLQSNVFSSNFVSGFGRIEINVQDEFAVNNGPGFTANSLALDIAGGALNVGQTYHVNVEFAAIQQMASPFLDGTAVSIYNAQTEFQIYAVPEPGTWALLAGLAALGGACVRRRRMAM